MVDNLSIVVTGRRLTNRKIFVTVACNFKIKRQMEAV